MTPTEKRKANLKPFQKGQSGNPGGRPKVAQDFRERCQEFMADDGWKLMINMAHQGSGEDARFALKAAMEYAYGKPKEIKDVNLNGSLNVGLREIPDEVLESLLEQAE